MDEKSNLSLATKSRTFDLEEKLQSKKYNSDFAIEMKGKDVNVSYFQANGFPYPLLIKDKTGLGMRIPSVNFTVCDIKRCVGSRHNVDVVDSEKGTRLVMTMKEWVRYYESKERNNNLNVTNLEFTNTKLETYVEQPELVRLVDWIHHAWPLYSNDYHAEDQQLTTSSQYPKMQRFCIMTVAKSYSDFHIDMAGSSVWYHILHGKKTMWLIPPTEANFEQYKKWMASDHKSFFADVVPACQRICLETGSTILIPSGWIHSVYTAEDSLCFSGNFLHSFSIQDQLRVFRFETENNVRPNICSPYFNELHWYVIESYVHSVSGISHRVRSEEEMLMERDEDDSIETKHSEDSEEMDQKKKSPDTANDSDSPKRTASGSKFSSKSSTPLRGTHEGKSRSKSSSVGNIMKSVTVKLENCLLAETGKGQSQAGGSAPGEGKAARVWIHLTPYEIDGLKAIVEHLENLSSEEQGVPRDIHNPAELIKDLKVMLSSHSKDNAKLSVSGQPVLMMPCRKVSYDKIKPKFKMRPASKSSTDGNFIRRRRVRCKRCEPCTRSECGECPFCKDMKKFGGLGRMKQTCISRQCMAPILPTAAVCVICEKGDASSPPAGSGNTGGADGRGNETSSSLMECGICWKILHPSCLYQKYPDLSNEGILNEDLPNSWECPRCCDLGKQGQLKPRVVKGLGFVLKQRQECHNVLSSSEESDDNSVEQEKSAASTPASGKKLPTKRRLLADKEGTPKYRKRKILNDEREPEQLVNKKPIATEALGLKDEKTKFRPLSQDKNEVVGGEVSGPSTFGLPSSQDLTVGRNCETQSQSTVGSRSIDLQTDRSKDYVPHPTPFPPTIPKVAVNKYVVRPAPIPPPPKFVPMEDGSMHPLDRDLWIRILRNLTPTDLAQCMSVSKTFNRWCYDRRLWHSINLTWRQIRQTHLIGIVRRQPKRLDLSWTNISHKQLLWLLNRLPHLKHLNLAGNSWPAVSSLCCCAYPYLFGLNLNWVSGVVDACVKDLFSPPIDHRPGVDPTIGHLDRCTELHLAGSDITNASLEIIVNHLTRLKRLDLSYCIGIDDKGIEILADDKSTTQKTLKILILSSCSRLTSACVEFFAKMQSLEVLELQACPKILQPDIEEFIVGHLSCNVKWLENDNDLIQDNQT